MIVGPTFEWDEDKARANLAKHGVSFGLGATVFDDPFHIVSEDRFAIGEYRLLALGDVGGVLLAVVFSEPAENVIRLISVRRATPAERKIYDQTPR